jgi:cyclopropane fatty-acyl-phospholipid synthase-like methyltransferase
MLSKILSFSFINLAQALGFIEFYQPTFNPRNIRFIKQNNYKRTSDDRVDIITKHVPMEKIENFLDVGSQLGYFTLTLAQRYHIQALGIDQDMGAYYYSKCLKNINDKKNVRFLHDTITPQKAAALEKFDLISLLSVFHHLVKYQGFQAADRIVDELVAKCKYFIFETGQSNETDMLWSKNLSFMDKSTGKWLEKYLKSKKLIILHHSLVPTHLSSVKRHFFVCENLDWLNQ